MANSEHVNRLLNEGVEAWNEWRREEGKGVRAGLRGANLTEADLEGVRLTGADLREAHFAGAILFKADLQEAILFKADLQEANLIAAYLSGADLRGAYLAGADLREAHVTGANLGGADLSGANLIAAYLGGANLGGADLTDVTLYETMLINVDLSTVTGLDKCKHHGPSCIDHRTLARSGKLPLSFLQGCGLSDWEIQAASFYQKELGRDEATDIAYELVNTRFGNPFQYESCFISHSTADKTFCDQLHDRLQEEGIRTWFAPKDMRGGRKLFEQLERGIYLNDRLLLVLTEESMRSNWVQFEILTALERERSEGRDILFPISLVDFDRIQRWQCRDPDTGRDMAKAVREYHILGEFKDWQNPRKFDTAFQKLLRDLRPDDSARNTKLQL